MTLDSSKSAQFSPNLTSILSAQFTSEGVSSLALFFSKHGLNFSFSLPFSLVFSYSYHGIIFS
jgi:hypothetical protein